MGGSISVRNDSSITVDVSTCLVRVQETKRCKPGEIVKFDTSMVWFTLKVELCVSFLVSKKINILAAKGFGAEPPPKFLRT